MKKHFLFTCMAVIALLMGACNEEENLRVHDGNEVTFNVTIPELGTSTRAVGDGLTATTLYWGVYDHNKTLLEDISNTTNKEHKVHGGKTFSKSTKLTLTLAKDKQYSIIFWAANAGNSMCTVDWTARTMTVAPEFANQESYDAFCKYEVIDNVSGYMTRDIKLKRPFAQINIGTADFAKAAASGLTVQNTKVEIAGLHTNYDFVTGNSDVEATFGYNYPNTPVSFDGEKFPVEDDKYDYLSMNYALISADKKLVDVTFTYIDDDAQEHTRTYASVPVQRNWRTNIYGNILTSEADFTVTIMPEFDGNHNEEIWDGKKLVEPEKDGDTYFIDEPGNLAWLAASVNGTLVKSGDIYTTKSADEELLPAESYKGKTIVLRDNIDLDGCHSWTPIGLKGNRFMGTFDGQGHTISNLKISTADNGAQAALFGDVNRAVIKNFTIDNANVLYPANYSDDFYGAAVVSQAYMVTLQKITVKNSTIQGNNKVAAILAHDADGAAMVIEDCHVEGCTIETKNDADGGNAAGIVGSVQGSKSTKSLKNCSVKNTTFNVVNSADAGKRSNAQMVATIIATAETVVTLEDCVVEGNTFNQTGVENYETPYDGIFVGGARESTTGKVFINGVQYPLAPVYIGEVRYESLADALKASKDGDEILVRKSTQELGGAAVEAANVTIVGDDKERSVVKLSKSIYLQGKSITFKNLTYTVPTGLTYNEHAFAFVHHATAFNFENCNIDGRLRLNVNAANIDNCNFTINTTSGFDGYSLFYYGNDKSTVNVKNSTFNTAGKAIVVYSESRKEYNLNVENCTFTSSNNATDKAAIQMHSELGIFGTLTVKNSTATGFADKNGGLWYEVNNNTGKVNDNFVKYIDGVRIYSALPEEIALDASQPVLFNAFEAEKGVKVSGNGTIVLDGTSINAASGAAITLAEGANVTLELKNGVSIIGETDAIAVPEGATLTLKGETQQAMLARTRTATANEAVTYEFIGNAGSGINAAGATVTIENLHGITAKGNGDHAFGIGGNGANVTIKNSTIDYVCGGHIQPLFVNDTKYGKSEPEGGAAIGGAKIKIEGSTITKADGGSKAAAIGAQYHQSTDIEILNSTILEANGGNASAGIGGSRYSSNISADDKQSAVILIANSTVTATGGQGGAGIGSGYDTHCAANDVNAVNDITIISSTVTAQGGKYAAGIGTGFHAAALKGSIDAASTIKATSGEAFYKEAYSTAQNIGYGVVDPTREFAGAKVTFTVAGKVIEAPFDLTYSNGTYTVYTAAGLVDLSSKTIMGNEKVLLGANIDLQDVEFNGLTAFNPESNNTFDGQYYTVSNWTYTGGASDMGFIKNWVGSIKNVSFYNCKLKTGGRSAVVVAKPYADIENVHVDACSIEDSYWACGLIAGMHNSGSVKSCTVTNSSVKSNGGTGAIVGVLNETGGERNLTNCSVTGSTINNTGVYGDAYSGAALVGMINISNATVTFSGCSQSGNTFVGGHVYDAFHAPASDDITIVIE